LAPTHELSRQLSSFAKALLHDIELRVPCASKVYVKIAPRVTFTASRMAAIFVNDSDGLYPFKFTVLDIAPEPVGVHKASV